MSAPETAATASEALRQQYAGGVMIGSAMTRAINVLRREHFDNEAADLESALLQLGSDAAAATAEQETDVPLHLRGGLDAYIESGRPVGGFLQAVLSNDLADAVTRADAVSLRGLKAVINYLRRPEVPTSCHGSVERVREWLTLSTVERAAVLTHVRAELDDGGLR